MKTTATSLVCALISLFVFACGSAAPSAPRTAVEANMDLDADHVDAEVAEKYATQVRQMDMYSKPAIEARVADTFVVPQSEPGERVAVTPPKTEFGDLTKGCTKLRQIIGYEEVTPLFTSEEAAGSYALAHPEIFPPQGADADGNPLVVIITRPVCRDKHLAIDGMVATK